MDSNDTSEIEHELNKLEKDLAYCTSCGICAEHCSTFQATGWEHQSPRGRIHLAQAWIQGKISPDSEALTSFDDCMGCQSCERACPLTVPYNAIHHSVQKLRLELVPSTPSSISRALYLKWIKAAYRIGSPRWRKYGWKWLTFPWMPLPKKRSYLKKNHTTKSSHSLTLIIGCVQDLFCHNTIDAAISLLSKMGYSVYLPSNQTCCGAIFNRLIYSKHPINSYQTEHRRAINDQKKRTEAFLKTFSSMTCFLSLNCQCYFSLKYKDQLFKVIDFYELIFKEIQNHKWKLALKEKRTVYYQPYCGQPKQLAQDFLWQIFLCIEQLTVRLLPYSSSCCGGYGCETLFSSDHAKQLIQPKISQLPIGATILVTSFDCQNQFLTHQNNKHFIVLHAIDFLSQTLNDAMCHIT